MVLYLFRLYSSGVAESYFFLLLYLALGPKNGSLPVRWGRRSERQNGRLFFSPPVLGGDPFLTIQHQRCIKILCP